VVKVRAASSVQGSCVASHLEAHASHPATGEVAQPGRLACPSKGDEVPGFPERTWSADLSAPAEVRKVCLVDLVFAGTALMTVGHRRIMAGQRQKSPGGGTSQIPDVPSTSVDRRGTFGDGPAPRLRLPGLAPRSRTGLRWVRALRELADFCEGYQVRRLREAGHSWARIAAWAGVSPQAVHKKYAQATEMTKHPST
jgi:hypothetical protein